MVRGKLVADASTYLDQNVYEAVTTVTAYFNDFHRHATKDAGKISVLDVLRNINEPTATSFSHRLDKKHYETILVFDLESGTFNVSILEVGHGVFKVLAVFADTHLGGDEFDKCPINWLVKKFKNDDGLDLIKDREEL